MGIRDEEIQRLKKYAQALGTKLTFKPYVKFSYEAAKWILHEDNSVELIIFTEKNKSKTQMILEIIHELAHQLGYVYKGRQFTEKLSNALQKEDHEMSKAERKAIYDMEVNDAKFQDNIFEELNIKIPKWKLDLEKDNQEYLYRYFYENGKNPSVKEKSEMRKKLREKYK